MSLDKEVTEYASKTPRSRALHEEAVAVMPGGNSRTTTFFDPYPFYFQRGQARTSGMPTASSVSTSTTTTRASCSGTPTVTW